MASGLFQNLPIMPFSPVAHLTLLVPTNASTISLAFSTGVLSAKDLSADCAFVQNNSTVVIFFNFTAAAATLVPGGVVTAYSAGMPILAGMGVVVFLTPTAKYINASAINGAPATSLLRVSIGRGQ